MLPTSGNANVFQFVQGLFGTALNNTVAMQVTAGFAAIQGWMHFAGAVWLLATAYLALSQSLSIGRFFTRLLRVLVVSAIVTHPDLYTRFIVQPFMRGLPDLIGQAFGGQIGAQNMPDQFAAIFNAIEQMSAQLRAEANGLYYIADRIVISLAELSCKLLLVPQYALFIALQAFIALVVIIGTITIIFWMFDKTQGYAEAWVGKLLGALLTLISMSIVLQFIFLMNTSYIQYVGKLPLSQAGAGLNVSQGASVLINIAVVFALGIILMLMSFIVGFGIARASGFDAGVVLRPLSRLGRG